MSRPRVSKINLSSRACGQVPYVSGGWASYRPAKCSLLGVHVFRPSSFRSMAEHVPELAYMQTLICIIDVEGVVTYKFRNPNES